MAQTTPLKNLLNANKFLLGLSPMDGITDAAFRLTQTQIAKPDLIFTEFVSAEGLAHNAVKLYDTLLFSPQERPIIGQLFGKDPQSFYTAAVILCHLGFDGIDINFGCPAKTVTQHGSGAALIAQPQLARDIINSVKTAIDDFATNKVSINSLQLKPKVIEAINRNLQYSPHQTKIIPTLSVKTRLGIDTDVSKKWIPFLLHFNLDFLTLHGRTLRQGYAGLADWQAISRAGKLAKSAGVYFFGNGDIDSSKKALEYSEKYHTPGILIGRAAMGNPWVFTGKQANFTEKYQAMLLHAQNFLKIFPHRRFDPLRRHFLLYVSGHPRAKALRQEIVQLTSIEQLCSLEEKILNC
mgnify:CR=1 FL=1